jgi:hypothetical protein
MAPLLFVVSRTHPDRYEFLRHAFTGEDSVEVVLDRRARSPHKDAVAGDRRSRRLDAKLATDGWALVRRLPGAG